MKRITPDPIAIGDRIELVYMPNDPCPIEPGSRGTVTDVGRFITGLTEEPFIQIGVKWDNGRTLMLSWPPDVFRKLEGLDSIPPMGRRPTTEGSPPPPWANTSGENET